MMKLYSLVWVLLAPLAGFVWQSRLRQGKEDPTRRHERFGRPVLPRPHGTLVWLHGASVGESLSLLVLIDEMRRAHPSWRYLVTTGTVTSARLMAQRLPYEAVHQYIPYDNPAWVGAFIDHWKPHGVIWCESEIWPGLLTAVRQRGIPAVLLNARMSETSASRWQWVRGWARQLIGTFQFIAAQTPAIAVRFRQFTDAPVLELGNLKFVNARLPVDHASASALRPLLQSRKVWLIASTHPGEEQLAADIHQKLKHLVPGLLTIIALRHPQRADAVTASLPSDSIITRRSQGQLPTGDIYLWDTLGEMGTLYDCVKLVAMGGSFAHIGGHNPIEPAQFGCAVICGPHMFNFAAIMETFKDQNAILQVPDSGTLSAMLQGLLAVPVEITALGARAEAVCQTQHETL
ncbi:MAG: 3-deoxy-D-manno-octulosonic acid transferase, partial [Bdellovibrionales bacterium]